MDETGVRRLMIWASITIFCRFAMWLLSPVIYIWTLYLAYLTSFPAILGALVIPVIPQLYFIWMSWNVTGVLLNLYSFFCLAWVVLAVIGIFSRVKAETVA